MYLKFREDGALETVRADFILGADGVHSRVRSFLMRKTR
jgi:2-polyprenyl-6-methoxyphenol hydroxylase-like FAD-dependent oxidoreductase